MRTVLHFPDRRTSKESALSVFLAGLPDFRRGRIVTASSDVDSWRKKPHHIARRMAELQRKAA